MPFFAVGEDSPTEPSTKLGSAVDDIEALLQLLLSGAPAKMKPGTDPPQILLTGVDDLLKFAGVSNDDRGRVQGFLSSPAEQPIPQGNPLTDPAAAAVQAAVAAAQQQASEPTSAAGVVASWRADP